MSVITPLPAPPSRADPVNFATRADAFLPALVTMANEMNTAITVVNNGVTSVEDNVAVVNAAALDAAQQAAAAADSATAAANSVTSALNLSNTNATSSTSLSIATGSRNLTIETGKAIVAGQFVIVASTINPITNYMFGQVSSYNSVTGALVVNVTIVNGSGTFNSWNVALSGFPRVFEYNMIRQPVGSATTLNQGFKGYFIDVTSGTFTLSFSAASSLGDGWWCYIRNGGTGDVTLDPNGTETIDGVTSFIMYPGEVRVVHCDGTTLRSFVLESFLKVFTSTNTFTRPPGYQMFGVEMWGGGGSGGASSPISPNAGAAAGGGGGAYNRGSYLFAEVNVAGSPIVDVFVGAGGNAVVATSGNGTNGQAGGTSQFLNTFAYGGGGGNGVANFTASVNGGGGGGTRASGSNTVGGSGWNTAETGMAPNAGTTDFSDFGGSGGGSCGIGAPNNPAIGRNSRYGGAGGGSVSGPSSGSTTSAGGTSLFGGNGGAGGLNTGVAGSQRGGGGGGAKTNGSGSATSGAGGVGEVRIWGMV